MKQAANFQLDLFSLALGPIVPIPAVIPATATAKVKTSQPLRVMTRRKVAQMEAAKAAGIVNDDRPAATPGVRGRNFRLALDRGLARGWKARAQDNLAAIRILEALTRDDRAATAAEQAELIKFTAFSSTELAQNIFPADGVAKDDWATLVAELDEMVTEDERASLMRATQYAHYTPEYITRAVWSAVSKMGFTGGRVLEPGCGVGIFMATAPDALMERIAIYGVENDPISARIAAKILPNAVIRQQDFTRAHLPDAFDLAIGNPPFSERTAAEPETGNRYSLHDLFIIRSLAALRTGGVAAFVVSRWTMDKTDTTARRRMNELADFLGAVRLPAKALRHDAGTDVVVDILFFSRRAAGAEPGPHAKEWISLFEAAAADPDLNRPSLTVNQYYEQNHAMVLGAHGWASSAHGPAYTCDGNGVGNLNIALAQAMQNLPSGVFVPSGEPLAPFEGGEEVAKQFWRTNAQGATVREGSYLMKNGQLHQVVNHDAVPVPTKPQHADGLSKRAVEIIKAFIPVRDATRAILRAQEANIDWKEPQRALARAYAAFYAKYGAVNTTKTIYVTSKETGETSEQIRRPNLSALMDDPDVWLVSSIEDYDQDTGVSRKGPIFTQRVVNAPSEPVVVTAADALSLSLHERGTVDIKFICDTLGQNVETVTAELQGAIFHNPANREWEMADQYLSGPVRTKLAVALKAAEQDPAYIPNVEALKKAQPEDLKPSEIAARLGSPWIDPRFIMSFVDEVLSVKTEIYRLVELGTWSVTEYPFHAAAASTTEWGTTRRHAGLLLEDALNSRVPQIYDVIEEEGREVRRINATETEGAKEKLSKIKAAFQEWIWQDADRAEALARVYNETMNNLLPRHFDGSHLTLPGASNIISLYEHQKRAIWRGIATGSMYLAHAVGAGKTYTMAALIMEQKRLGLISKAMLVVPGHCLAQVSREFVQLYPNAKILVADEANFVKAKRQRFIARAATGDFDAIICTHSAFKFIEVAASFERSMVKEQLTELELLIKKVEGDDRVSRKRIEAQKEKLREKLESLRSRKDDFVTLGEIGVDQIMVDEAQEFRKLSFITNQSNLLGVDPNGSQRAWDLYVKNAFLNEKNPGRALIMASGTPITNTIGELFTVKRFFCPELLNGMGMSAFDAWAANFGDVRTELELQPSGNYKAVTRFCEFVNVPELVDIFRSFADVVLPETLSKNVKVPSISGGVRKVLTAPANRMFKGFQRALERRIRAIQDRSGKAMKGDDILLSVINDGRHAAIDMRLINANLPNDPESKLNLLVDNVFEIYTRTADHVYYSAPGIAYDRKGATQMIFSDLGTPSAEERRGFSVYSWIKHRLVEMGVPPEEIAIIHDYPKTSDKVRLFNELKAGIKRVCIGSTKKMGTGVNAQLRLKALHHLDVPWLPSDVEQRDGRIRRQGNQNEEVEIYCYATLTSMDATLWSTLTRKQTFISAALSGDRSVRRLEDAGSQENQFAMAKAIASGDQRLMRKAGLEGEILRFYRLKDNWIDSQVSIRREIQDARHNIGYYSQRIEEVRADLDTRTATAGDLFSMEFMDEVYTERKRAGVAALKSLMSNHWNGTATPRFKIGGMEFNLRLVANPMSERKTREIRVSWYRSGNQADRIDIPENVDPLGLIRRIENALKGIEFEIHQLQGRLDRSQKILTDYTPRLGGSFEFQAELESKLEELKAIEEDLAATGDVNGSQFDEFDEIANMFSLLPGSHVPFVERPATVSNEQGVDETEKMVA